MKHQRYDTVAAKRNDDGFISDAPVISGDVFIGIRTVTLRQPYLRLLSETLGFQ